MDAMDELVQLSESMRQAASLLADDDPSDEAVPRRPSTFLNAVALGNVVSPSLRRNLQTSARPPRPI
jgi:dynamin GTPase